MKALCRALVLVIGFVLACLGVTRSLAAQSPQTAPAQGATAKVEWRLGRLEEWLTAVRRHEFGQSDAEVAAIGSWSSWELNLVVRELIHLPREIRPWFEEGRDWPVWYRSRWLLRQGIWLYPGDLEHLGMTADEILALDFVPLLKRVAVFHADVGMLALEDVVAAGAARSDLGNATLLADGQVTGTAGNNVHWDFGRRVLDLLSGMAYGDDAVRAARSDSDGFVRAWYAAVAAHLERVRRVTQADAHLRRARELFPRDARLLFAGGCVMEEQTSPEIQLGLRSIDVPPGTTLEVWSVDALLNNAEGLFRRAAELDPQLAEARLRLGRIAGLRGRHEAAIKHLQTVVASERRPDLLYLAHLFLGDEQRALEQWTAAQSSYERAAALYPLAQSPLVALSHLARARGDRAAAVRVVERLLRLPAASLDERELAERLPETSRVRYDPWWFYYRMQGQNADALFEDLYRRVSEGRR